jgi:hypothetical protein
VLAALNYRELHTLRQERQIADAEFSERIRRAATLQADWIFRGSDAMKRLRAADSSS